MIVSIMYIILHTFKIAYTKAQLQTPCRLLVLRISNFYERRNGLTFYVALHYSAYI